MTNKEIIRKKKERNKYLKRKNIWEYISFTFFTISLIFGTNFIITIPSIILTFISAAFLTYYDNKVIDIERDFIIEKERRKEGSR